MTAVDDGGPADQTGAYHACRDLAGSSGEA